MSNLRIGTRTNDARGTTFIPERQQIGLVLPGGIAVYRLTISHYAGDNASATYTFVCGPCAGFSALNADYRRVVAEAQMHRSDALHLMRSAGASAKGPGA